MSAQIIRPRTSRSRMWLIVIGLGVVGAIVIAVMAAATASNTVAPSTAGIGEGAVTGYAVSNVSYTLNASDPSKVDAVAFTLDTAPPAGGTIAAKLSQASTTWYSCTVSGTSAVCATTSPQATVLQITELVIVAAQ